MTDIVSFNIFSGNLINTPSSNVSSVPIELFTNDDAEFNPALKTIEYNQAVFKFSQGQLHTIRGRFKVPSDYTVGILQFAFPAYAASIINGFKFNLRSFLYLPDSGIVGSETLYHDADTGTIANSGVAETYRNLLIAITDNNSKIGGVTVTAGALIDFRLQRSTLSSGDDTDDIRVVPNIEIIIS